MFIQNINQINLIRLIVIIRITIDLYKINLGKEMGERTKLILSISVIYLSQSLTIILT